MKLLIRIDHPIANLNEVAEQIEKDLQKKKTQGAIVCGYPECPPEELVKWQIQI